MNVASDIVLVHNMGRRCEVAVRSFAPSEASYALVAHVNIFCQPLAYAYGENCLLASKENGIDSALINIRKPKWKCRLLGSNPGSLTFTNEYYMFLTTATEYTSLSPYDCIF